MTAKPMMKSPLAYQEGVAEPSLSSRHPSSSGLFAAKALTCDNARIGSDSDLSVYSTATESDSDTDEIDTEDLCAQTVGPLNESTNNAKHRRRSVSFGPIHVRHYERVIGDHPETKVGVPVSLGWAFHEDDRHPDGISIERYECDRIRKRTLRMSSITRKNMMMHVFGVPEKEIIQAERATEKNRRRRETTGVVTQTGGTAKKIGRSIRKGGLSFLKGMAIVGQVGITSNFRSNF